MPNPVLVLPAAGAKVYQAGRIGFESNFQDIGSVNYACTLRSDPQSPVGEAGEVWYRGIALRVRRQGGFTIGLKVFIDGVQTKLANGNDQAITFTRAPTAEREDVLEAAIRAKGTDVYIELSITSNDITGFLLVEEALAFFVPVTVAKRTPDVETQ